jgi:hypothetical protein
VGEGVEVGVSVGVGDGVAVGVAVGVGVGVEVGVFVAVGVGVQAAAVAVMAVAVIATCCSGDGLQAASRMKKQQTSTIIFKVIFLKVRKYPSKGLKQVKFPLKFSPRWF